MLLSAAITIGFVGSLHCIGMCGPIALALPLKDHSLSARLQAMLFYNAGRIATYAFMGLLFGLLGKGLTMAVSQNVLSVTTGIIIILLVLFPRMGMLSGITFMSGPFQRARFFFRSLFDQKSAAGLFFIGVLNGFLPCGLVYISIAGAVTTGSALSGSAFMAAFGLGTVPAMALVMFSRGLFTTAIREKLRGLVPVFICITACLLILRGLNLDIPYISPASDAHAVKECCSK